VIKKALCIGNAAYPEEALANPVNDARDIASKLTALGFTCSVLRDAKIASMQQELKTFSEDLVDTEVGLFFFAGHGMQIDGDNYLTAIDTDFEKELDAKYSSLPLNKVIEVLEKGKNATSIIILDACRNNPYERRWRGVGSRGLAPVYAPKGTIVAYATSPGQVASDGLGENGAFTASLLRHIASHNVTIEDLFKRVRNTLSASTSGKQISWEHTCLMGDFFFNQAILTDDFIAEYSKNALADAGFQCQVGRRLADVIKKLRSRDWYQQNPAVTALNSVDWSTAEKDELFVLGRNLYQTACGGSRTADTYFSSLATKLGALEREVVFHILNGILYEIYFDSHDRFREKKKTERLDDVFALELAPDFKRSFEFIRQALMQHEKYLFYVPGAPRDVLVDVTNTKVVEGKSSVRSISVDGQDVFYDADGQTLVANAEVEFHFSQTVEQFESGLSSIMVTPRGRLKLTYLYTPEPDSSLVVPYDYRIQRVSM